MRWLLIGDVPDVLRQAASLADSDADFVFTGLDEHHATDHDFAVVHLSEADHDHDVLDVLDEARTPYAVSTPLVTPNFLRTVFSWHRAHPVLETGAPSAPKTRKITELAKQLAIAVDGLSASVAEVPADAIPIGSYFDSNEDYARLRSLSLMSPVMGSFMQTLRDAVQAMRVPEELKPPWRWRDDGPPSIDAEGRLIGQQPNLIDVMTAVSRPAGRHTARQLLERAGSWHPNPAQLLILGESGTGKTLVAELVRDWLFGNDADYPFVEINCGGLGGGTQLDHVLHGAAGGSWTSIERPVVGSLARASYGMVFFDEIGDLEIDAQKKLLTYLQTNMVTPVDIQPFFGRTRVVAATNRDLATMVSRNAFRHDLLWRFTRRVQLPSLRERVEEIPRLIDYAALNPAFNSDLEVTHISTGAHAALSQHQYSDGNFRELEFVVHSALQRAKDRRSRIIERRDISFEESTYRQDRDAHVIDVAPGFRLPDAGPLTSLATQRDLERLAALTRQPVLRDRTTKALMVRAPEHNTTYVYRVPD